MFVHTKHTHTYIYNLVNAKNHTLLNNWVEEIKDLMMEQHKRV